MDSVMIRLDNEILSINFQHGIKNLEIYNMNKSLKFDQVIKNQNLNLKNQRLT